MQVTFFSPRSRYGQADSALVALSNLAQLVISNVNSLTLRCAPIVPIRTLATLLSRHLKHPPTPGELA